MLPKELEALLAPDKKRSAAETKKLRDHYNKNVFTEDRKKIAAMKQLDRAKQLLDGYRGDILPRVMVMSDAQLRETHILDRGAYLSKKEKVTFDAPGFLPPLPKDAPKNRLGLAQWLFRPEHPLTARVQVNRQWQHFFGFGIVRTSEDLGVQSDRPTHQELLDWLSVEFRESGWKTKALQRLIVTSKTYRQSSRVTKEHLQKDPENKLLARAPRLRLPSLILATSPSARAACSPPRSAARRSTLTCPTARGRASRSPRSATSPTRSRRAPTSTVVRSTPSGVAPSRR